MRVREGLLDLLFPPKCPYCQRVLDDPRAPLCPRCQPSLPWLEGRAGERRIDFADGCFSPLAYGELVREAIHRYKFSRVRALGRPFAAVMAQCLKDRLPEGAGLICWAPLSKERLRERGFDQAELMAREVGRLLSIPAGPVLVKMRDTGPQSELEEDSARRANARGAYALLPGTDLTGKRVVLVDDVVTSGSTLEECAALLRQAGAEQVFCLTLARARGD
ncbi:ComF family protein [Colidextribacter sp. OB.20]|uniref:ComF family protein n=1 Tax=Colidextribacter sp. OB.20 TaxID=2304568 RepID=UPI00136C69DF|nr:ComF family protein [Colidextribacter sp. OB.20]NBI10685.1 ComF family protein [Colidextribacter sp. OB.20]